MSNKDLIWKGLALAGAATMVSSFFVKDNSKAVNRRWIALGLFGASWAVELGTKVTKKA